MALTIEQFADWVESGWTRKVATEQDDLRELAVMTLGLPGEVGEVIEHIKKEIRGDGPLDKEKLKLELGDVQHYLCRIARRVRHLDAGNSSRQRREDRSPARQAEMGDAIVKLYLAGPMSGYPQFNFPAFYAATKDLRARGYEIISPAELDEVGGTDKEAMASADGDASKLTKTWGDLLARDVKIVADQVDGVIFLQTDWAKSKGAKLEAFVALLCKHKFYQYHGPDKEITEVFLLDVFAEIRHSLGYGP